VGGVLAAGAIAPIGAPLAAMAGQGTREASTLRVICLARFPPTLALVRAGPENWLVVEGLVVEQQVFVERTEWAGGVPDRHFQYPEIGLGV